MPDIKLPRLNRMFGIACCLSPFHSQNLVMVQSHLKRFADEANKDFPKKIDAETAVLRIDVTNAGIVNRYKATSLTYSQIRRAGIMDQIKPVLRQQSCSNRSYRKAMEKGFTVSYSYVDRDNVPAGVVTITRTDCGI